MPPSNFSCLFPCMRPTFHTAPYLPNFTECCLYAYCSRFIWFFLLLLWKLHTILFSASVCLSWYLSFTTCFSTTISNVFMSFFFSLPQFVQHLAHTIPYLLFAYSRFTSFHHHPSIISLNLPTRPITFCQTRKKSQNENEKKHISTVCFSLSMMFYPLANNAIPFYTIPAFRWSCGHIDFLIGGLWASIVC